MFAFINGRSLNARLMNWALIKQLIAKKNIPIPVELIDATLHGKDGGAEGLLEYTYQILTNKKYWEEILFMSFSIRRNYLDHLLIHQLNVIRIFLIIPINSI